VAPVYIQAKIAFRRLKRALAKGTYAVNETELTITLLNGAIIWFKGADKPDSLYGEDVYGAVVDEASRCKREAWHAIRSTLTHTRGPLRVIGNVKGRKNWAYELARRAESGTPDMAYFKLTAWDAVEAGVLDREEIEDARRQLPENVFRELYLAEPADDGGNPFGLSHIRACIGELAGGEPKGWGWDLAKSQDYTSGIALNQHGHICQMERFQNPWELTIALIAAATERKPALVDSTGVGDPVLEALQKRGRNFRGFKFNPGSKQQLMEGLAVAIQQGTIGKTIPKDSVLLSELESFEYEYTRTGVRYTAPEGLHDDTVIALALAVELNRKRFTMDVSPGEITQENAWRV
jgi:hypothetical protein